MLKVWKREVKRKKESDRLADQQPAGCWLAAVVVVLSARTTTMKQLMVDFSGFLLCVTKLWN